MTCNNRGHSGACQSVCGLLWLFIISSFAHASANLSNDRWLGSGSHPDVNDRVRAIQFDSMGRVYAGGCFRMAGGLTGAQYVAMWNPSTRVWTNLGVSVSGPSFALYIDQDDYVFVTGSFSNSCGVEANGIARWDPATETWANLGTGANGIIRAVVADSMGHLYVGGGFSLAGGLEANNIAMWNGVNWTNLGAGVNSEVFALAVGDNGTLYAGGLFTEADGIEAISVAAWNPTERVWTNLAGGLGDGVNDGVDALLVDTNGHLYAGGFFTHSGGMPMTSIARWNGGAWTNVGSGLDGSVYVLAKDQQGILYAGGFFNDDELSSAPIMHWNGHHWQPFVHDMHGYVIELSISTNGVLFAGGEFTIAWNPTIRNIAYRDGASWSSLADGPLDGMIETLALDGGGTLYAGGLFTRAGGDTNTRHVARWDENASAWTNLGPGVNGPVYALAADTNGNLLAGGAFTQAGGGAAAAIARWDPLAQAWTNLAGGLTGTNAEINAIGIDPASGRIYAGGWFEQADATPAANIAVWDPSTGVWTNLNAGVNGRVRALAIDPDGQLYVGGAFTTAGGQPANRVARWNPVAMTWTNLGVGLSDQVYTLLFDDQAHVIAGGLFDVGNPPGFRVARWNAALQTWEKMGGGVHGSLLHQNSFSYVAALAKDGEGLIYAGGNFMLPAMALVQWNSNAWTPLGAGVNGVITALAYEPADNILYAAGAFSRAGGKPSPGIARVILLPGNHDTDGDGLPDWWELAFFGGRTNAIPQALAANNLNTVRDLFIAAGDPHDPAFAFPAAVRMDIPSQRPALMVSTTSPDRVYRLYASDDLSAAPQQWLLLTPEQTGTGSAVYFLVTNDIPMRIFRTGVRLP